MNTIVSSATAATESDKRVKIDLVGVYRDNDALEEDLEVTKDRLDSSKKKSSFITSEQILEIQKEAAAAKQLKEAVEKSRVKRGSNYLYGYERDPDDEDEFCQVFDQLKAYNDHMSTSELQKLKEHRFTTKRQLNMFIYFNLELATRLAEKRERREHFIDVVQNVIDGAQSGTAATRHTKTGLPAIPRRKQVIEIDERTGRILPSCGKAGFVNTRKVRSRRYLAERSNQELIHYLAKRQEDPWHEQKRQHLQQLHEEKNLIDSRVDTFLKNIETFKKRSTSSGLEKLVSE